MKLYTTGEFINNDIMTFDLKKKNLTTKMKVNNDILFKKLILMLIQTLI